MKLLILGSTGMLGLVLTQAANSAGHDVTVLVRNPDKLGALKADVSVLEGEYFDPNALTNALKDVDAVLTTIGPPMRRSRNANEYTHAMRTLINAMQHNAVRRIIAVGGAGLRLNDEPMKFGRAIMRRVLIFLSGANYLDKEKEHNVLSASGLEWTILRPPQITETQGELTVSFDKVQAFKVDTHQLAKHMLDCLEDPSTIGTAPFVSSVLS